MEKVAEITKEPSGKVYEDLIGFGATHCKCFSLVWREEFEPGLPAMKIEENLKPYIIREEYTNKWPGTEIFGHRAYVRFYQFTIETIQILLSMKSLYKWLVGNGPEDLAFYLDTGHCILGSIAHEKESWIFVDEIPLETVKKEIPELEFKTFS